jgi:hypothetical protein
MNKSKVVSQLALVISQLYRGTSKSEIEQKLMNDGWSIGAIREAFDAASEVGLTS